MTTGLTRRNVVIIEVNKGLGGWNDDRRQWGWASRWQLTWTCAPVTGIGEAGLWRRARFNSAAATAAAAAAAADAADAAVRYHWRRIIGPANANYHYSSSWWLAYFRGSPPVLLSPPAKSPFGGGRGAPDASLRCVVVVFVGR
jgi:hypothetical protein